MSTSPANTKTININTKTSIINIDDVTMRLVITTTAFGLFSPVGFLGNNSRLIT